MIDIKNKISKILLPIIFSVILGFIIYQQYDIYSQIQNIKNTTSQLSRQIVMINTNMQNLSFAQTNYTPQSTFTDNPNDPAYNQLKFFVGSINSNIYHDINCRYVKKIKDSNRINFLSKEDAESKGYTPCSVCNP